MISKAQMQTVEDKRVISGLHWYALVWSLVSGDFSQTAFLVGMQMQVLECGSANR